MPKQSFVGKNAKYYDVELSEIYFFQGGLKHEGGFPRHQSAMTQCLHHRSDAAIFGCTGMKFQ